MDNAKIAKILAEGGHILMHKNDLERLKEAANAGNKPDLFAGVKVLADQTGLIPEGRPVAAKIAGDVLFPI